MQTKATRSVGEILTFAKFMIILILVSDLATKNGEVN